MRIVSIIIPEFIKRSRVKYKMDERTIEEHADLEAAPLPPSSDR
jgi:hypothetical protein